MDEKMVKESLTFVELLSEAEQQRYFSIGTNSN
jgi:hypothetical protein